MKKLLLFLLFLLICASLYYDMTEGTLTPSSVNNDSSSNIEVPTETSAPASNALEGKEKTEVIVEPGQTVLSIVEQLHDGPVPASIADISTDFQQLNNGIAPEDIQVDESYYFPVYNTP
ncbi:hypothetical protein SAMN05192534_10682 [Alteribacillus persepolensis]|uniref:LysM domain-containing protein n=1 Tax=Alteribacillus persepolensis TaxID=568899 RepID=A0A1G8CVQ9_9BACI|nr:hypothetical protein [Alteribacillus persepolensis]SDH49040.1 hypothetical protein SAMN05192534_10682 [Alteribacillus persepolensis]